MTLSLSSVPFYAKAFGALAKTLVSSGKIGRAHV